MRLIYFVVLQDAVVAKQYMSKNKEFQRQAKDWTQTYAAKPSATDSRVWDPLTSIFRLCSRLKAVQELEADACRRCSCVTCNVLCAGTAAS